MTQPIVKDTSYFQKYVGVVKAHQHIELRAIEEGYLEEIYVDEGQYVQEGQLMFRLLPIVYQAELKQAQAEVRLKEIKYQNTKALADSNIVSPVELQLAKAEWEKAKAELNVMLAHIQFTEIRAPFSGFMDKFHVRKGSLVEEGELLTSLSDVNTLWIYFNVPEVEYLRYKKMVKNDSIVPVYFEMADGTIFNQKGHISAIEADFNTETGNIAFRATFPNPDRLIRHGETGNILLEVPVKKALLIPQKSTFQVLDKDYVYVVDDHHRVQARHVSIGAEWPHIFSITKGLQPSDKIVLEGLRKINDGDTIEVEFIEPEEVFSNLELYAE
ncbi:MAG: efflux RND transporter periplasmic adaptor subunit [Bacteroidetes bacterium]|nr:MAG: efflux RND transporter periplasmic adaptor subunit [Bacteroidota bacterium]